MQTAGTRADKCLIGASFDESDIDARQGELAGQHQPCRAGTYDDDISIRHATSPS
jgi:hypothetical protein